MLGGGHDRKRVAHVQFADEVEVKPEAGNFKLRRRRRQLEIERVHGVVLAEAEAFDRTLRHVEQRRKVQVVAIGQQQAVARNQSDEVFERRLDGGQVLENVGVVKLQIVDNRDLRQVMNELAPLVEKRGVVFVPFDDDPFAVGKPRALAEIIWNSADEVARSQPVVLQDPGEQRRRSGLAVRAGYDDGTFAADEQFLQSLRQDSVT